MWERFPLKRGVGRLTTEESLGSAHVWHICDGALFIWVPSRASFLWATKVISLKPAQATLLLKGLCGSPQPTAAFPRMCYSIKHSTNRELLASPAWNHPPETHTAHQHRKGSESAPVGGKICLPSGLPLFSRAFDPTMLFSLKYLLSTPRCWCSPHRNGWPIG